VQRGVERSCRSIQFFNQSPRAWKPRVYSDEEVEAFRAAVDASDVDAVLIHAVYLLNCASEDREIRGKSLAALTAALRAGDALGAHCVVLHPGSALKGGGPVGEAITRAAETIAEALAESERCALHLEDTAGAGGTLGRTFEELASLIERAGGGERLGVCLDSCHLLASGYDVATAEGLAAVVDEFDAAVGLDRLGSLHLNDSATPLGSNVDRHADPGDGYLGREGCATFLSEPRFEDLPCVLELNGAEKRHLEQARELREEGRAARRR
jgi:deoxyribonuclease-4